jgi:hypothetical protein
MHKWRLNHGTNIPDFTLYEVRAVRPPACRSDSLEEIMAIDIIAAIIAVSVLAVVYVSAFCMDIRHCRSLRSPVARKSIPSLDDSQNATTAI